MARLYTDENFPVEVVSGLRTRGHDILTAYEAGRANQGIIDEEVLAFATGQRRAVITINRRDFMRLHMRQPNHARIIVCTHDSNFPRQVISIAKALSENPVLDGMLLRVNRPPK